MRFRIDGGSSSNVACRVRAEEGADRNPRRGHAVRSQATSWDGSTVRPRRGGTEAPYSSPSSNRALCITRSIPSLPLPARDVISMRCITRATLAWLRSLPMRS